MHACAHTYVHCRQACMHARTHTCIAVSEAHSSLMCAYTQQGGSGSRREGGEEGKEREEQMEMGDTYGPREGDREKGP